MRTTEPGEMGEALTAGRALGDDRARAQVLSRLAPRLPVEQQASALADALAAARAIGFGYWRTQALSELAPRLSQSQVDWAVHWLRTLPALAQRPRPVLLSDLAALAPLIRHLGGEAAVAETIRAIQDVTRWWP